MADISTQITLSLSFNEAVALGKLVGSISILNMQAVGLTEDQARICQSIYNQLADYVVIFECD